MTEIKATLDHYKHPYQDCTDLDSLRLHLAVCIKMTTFTMRLPQVHFTISKEITGFSKEVLLLIPVWQYQKVGAEFHQRSDGANPAEVVAREREFLADHFHSKKYLEDTGDPCRDGKIGTAAVRLWFHSGGFDDGDMIRRVNERPGRGQEFEEKGIPYEHIIMSLSPIPKNWKGNDYQDKVKTMEAIEIARLVAGECEAIEGIENIVVDL